MEFPVTCLIKLSILSILLITLMISVNGRMVDMTHRLNNRSIHFPLFRDFELKSAMKGEQASLGGMWVEANDLLLNEHTGTHMDAPAHTWKTGIHMDEIPLQDLIGPAVVIDITEKAKTNRDYTLTVEDVKEFEEKHGKIPDGAIVFINTDGAKVYWNPAEYVGSDTGAVEALHFPGFGGASVEWLITERNIKGIGCDRMSFDAGQNNNHEAHIALLSRGKIGIENANNVHKLPPVGATVFVMALPVEGGSGAPARIVAFWDTDIPTYSSSNLLRVSRFMTSIFVFLTVLFLGPA